MDTPQFSLSPKDFIETPDGLLFAVLSGTEESGRIPAYLRYRRTPKGLQKIATAEAPEALSAHGSRYYFDSVSRAIRLQGVARVDIHRVFRARERTLQILNDDPLDPVLEAAQKLLRFIFDGTVRPEMVGVTGSLLIGAQTPESDIDLVVYDRTSFERVRSRVLEGIQTAMLDQLSAKDWSEAHARRGASLTLEEYLRHEQRKGNKALIHGIKFDLTLLDSSQEEPEPAKSKAGSIDLRATVTDATEAFGFPARYRVDHPEIFEVLAFSQTYAGQAFEGERIRVRGRLEVLPGGRQRIVVGQDREAHGEFIKLDLGEGS
jgi:predicted nucleotidyltransferase